MAYAQLLFFLSSCFIWIPQFCLAGFRALIFSLSSPATSLAEALQKKIIAGAGLDVYVDEPNVPAELRKLDNVVLTPHIASATVETRKAMSALALANLEAFMAGQPVLTPVPECRV